MVNTEETKATKEKDRLHREQFTKANVKHEEIIERVIMTPEGETKTKFIRSTLYKNNTRKNRIVALHKAGRTSTDTMGVERNNPFIYDYRTKKEKDAWEKKQKPNKDE